MSTLELKLYSESEKREERRRTAFEYITALVIPSLALIGALGAGQGQASPRSAGKAEVEYLSDLVDGLVPKPAS